MKKLVLFFKFSWSIEARVTFKSAIKTYGFDRQPLFSLDLIDSSLTEIHAYFFQAKTCEKFYDLLETGQVYDVYLVEKYYVIICFV